MESTDENIVELIENQTWFFSEWKQDPTIQAMLTMLGGTSIKDNKANDIIDGFEEVFCNTDSEKFLEYWKSLSDESRCPIVFYHLDLLELKLSDDLYIKMNARGKQLTDFENFKADLVRYIKTENIEVETIASNTIAHKLDTSWTDIFWENKSPNQKIDEIYFAFINRLLLNCLIANKVEKNKYLYTVENLEKENKLFKYLYGDKGNDSVIEYQSFDIYSSEKSVIKTGINSLKTVLNKFDSSDINALFHPNWDVNSGFSFIPEYEKKDDKYIPTTLTQSQRVIFFAICCYFENGDGDFDKSNFKKWMRVVWNIVENANVETIRAIRLIDDLAEYSHDIYNHLKDRDISNDFAKEQMEEEKEKARQIVNNKEFKDKDGKTWEEKIVEAEKYAFFKGAVCFLFRVEEGKYDWEKFDARFENAKEFFVEEGVTDDYKKDAILLRSLISYFDGWGMFWEMVYDNSPSSWKNLLAKTKWIKPINCLFDDGLPDLNNWDSRLSEPNDAEKLVHEDLVKSQLLKVVQAGCKLNWRREQYALYPPSANANWKKYVIGCKRNLIFSSLCKETILCEQKLGDLNYFWGWEIYFTLKSNGKKYHWWDELKEQSETEEWIEVGVKKLEDLESYLTKLENVD